MVDHDPTQDPALVETAHASLSPVEVIEKKFSEIYELHMSHPDRNYVSASGEAEVARLSTPEGQLIDVMRPSLDRLPGDVRVFHIYEYQRAINLETGQPSQDKVYREFAVQDGGVFGEILTDSSGQAYFVEMTEGATELAQRVAQANLVPYPRSTA